jgi:hypothetical protein
MIEEKEEELNKKFYSTFHSAEGQVVLKDLLSQFYRGTSLTEDADPNKILINEGKRFVIIYILSRMETISKQQEDKEPS